jgi:hypothetical protein
MEGGALVVKTPQQMVREHGLYSGRVVERMHNLRAARLPGGGWGRCLSRVGGACRGSGRGAGWGQAVTAAC